MASAGPGLPGGHSRTGLLTKTAREGREHLRDEVPDRHVPGARASSVFAAAILDKFPRLLFKSNCRLGRFAKNCLREKTAAPSHGATGPAGPRRPIWPMPLPFPRAFAKGERSETRLSEKAVNSMVILLNFLDLGRPARAPEQCLGGHPLTDAQWEQVDRLRDFAGAWVSLPRLSAEDMGRTASKVESVEKILEELGRRAASLSKASGSPFEDDLAAAET